MQLTGRSFSGQCRPSRVNGMPALMSGEGWDVLAPAEGRVRVMLRGAWKHLSWFYVRDLERRAFG
jgi:hypothetical protein